MLRLVEAAMTCCDYTTEVDRPFKSEARRTHAQLKGITSILRGLVSACDYKQGQVRNTSKIERSRIGCLFQSDVFLRLK